MEMDLTQTRYLDWPGLERYCYRVASVVGLLAAGIFGYRDPRTLDYATRARPRLPAHQHHPRRRRGRAQKPHLPADGRISSEFGVPAADILNARETPEFRKLMAFEAARAREHYEKAMQALPAADRKPQRPGLIMAAIYRALLEEIERDGFRVLDATHVAHAAAQVLDRLENMDHARSRSSAAATPAWRPAWRSPSAASR